MDFQELFYVDSSGTLRFFHARLKEFRPAKGVSKEETLYVASVLASYAQASRFKATSVPPMASLSEVFDCFVFRQDELKDPEILEVAGAQSLLLVGFFRDQMRTRHNVRWYDTLGRSFYERASNYSREGRRKELFGRLSVNFSVWTRTCCDLSRNLRDNQFLLRPLS
ncbi:MAG: hypothetical protein HYT68_01555 [Candidatus Zambryskibacteria bacterium]|nr:hypothetical protein [Candidatus Zambryskibacteria bacterium]